MSTRVKKSAATEDNPTSLPSLRQLWGLAAVARPKQQRSWPSLVFFRPWTAYLSVLLTWARLRPSQVTLLSAVTLLLGGWMLAMTSDTTLCVGVALVLLYHTLDHCDGEVKRLRAATIGESPRLSVKYWDGVTHGLEVILPVAIGLRLSRMSGLGEWPLVVAAIDAAAMCAAPWQRYCEVVLGSKIFRKKECQTDLLDELIVADRPLDDSGDADSWSLMTIVRQAVLFPGYFLTLPLFVIIDLANGPLWVFEVADGAGLVELPWLLVWLVIHAVGKVASAVFGACRAVQRLGVLDDAVARPSSDAAKESKMSL